MATTRGGAAEIASRRQRHLSLGDSSVEGFGGAAPFAAAPADADLGETYTRSSVVAADAGELSQEEEGDEAPEEAEEALPLRPPTLREELADFCKAADLPPECIGKAHAWCQRVGAVRLTEALEFGLEIERALGLRMLEQRRFRAAAEERRAANRRLSDKMTRMQTDHQEELVPGLTEMMKDALLIEHVGTVERWAEEVGVDSLAELIEHADGMCELLKLTPMDKQRLRKVMAAHQVAAYSVGGRRTKRQVGSALAASTTGATQLDLYALLDAAHLSDHFSAAAEFCEAMGVRTLEEMDWVTDSFERYLGLGVLDQRRFKQVLGQQLADSQGGSAPAGLRLDLPGLPGIVPVLHTARLGHLLHEAQSWCEQMGAASMQEVAACCDELARHLSLKEMEQRRLRKAFVAYLGTQQASQQASQRTAEPEKDADFPPEVPGLVELLLEIRLSDKVTETERWCAAAGATSLADVLDCAEDAATHLSLRPFERRRFIAALQERCTGVGSVVDPVDHTTNARPPETSDEMPCGLVDAMREARLLDYLPHAQKWCAAMGCHYLENIVCEEVDGEFEKEMRFKPAELARFRKLQRDGRLAAIGEAARARVEAAQQRERDESSQLQEQAQQQQSAEQSERAERERREKIEKKRNEVQADSKAAREAATVAERVAVGAEISALRSMLWDMEEDVKLHKEALPKRRLLEEAKPVKIQGVFKHWSDRLAKNKNNIEDWQAKKDAAEAEKERLVEEAAKAAAKAKKGKKVDVGPPPDPTESLPSCPRKLKPYRYPVPKASSRSVWVVTRVVAAMKIQQAVRQRVAEKKAETDRRKEEEKAWAAPTDIHGIRTELQGLRSRVSSLRLELLGMDPDGRQTKTTTVKFAQAKVAAAAASEAWAEAEAIRKDAEEKLEHLARGSTRRLSQEAQDISKKLAEMMAEEEEAEYLVLRPPTLVEGLQHLLELAAIPVPVKRADDWCRTNGVDSPTALLNHWDEFLSAVGVEQAKRLRLRPTLLKWYGDLQKQHAGGSVPDTPAAKVDKASESAMTKRRLSA
eukprot:TRINITY_DN26494_c0_g1_i1.p1 TRINITY_DN26494_c0_g1~~TRINITY_DN26494_c0_g1_i1.p1  ORF type:complete len:1040 (+),score=251.58 TRINITY_DN26494_c0_g1_i1:107-3226(+)